MAFAKTTPAASTFTARKKAFNQGLGREGLGRTPLGRGAGKRQTSWTKVSPAASTFTRV